MTIEQEFIEARHAYRRARSGQREKIIEALRSEGFDVTKRGGRGSSEYTSGKRLSPSYDLSDWMWISANRGDVHVMVSLQVLDQDPDPRSKNIHALMDRIGVDIFRDGDPIDPDDPLREGCTTSFELPLSETDLKKLLALVEQKIVGLR